MKPKKSSCCLTCRIQLQTCSSGEVPVMAGLGALAAASQRQGMEASQQGNVSWVSLECICKALYSQFLLQIEMKHAAPNSMLTLSCEEKMMPLGFLCSSHHFICLWFTHACSISLGHHLWCSIKHETTTKFPHILKTNKYIVPWKQMPLALYLHQLF